MSKKGEGGKSYRANRRQRVCPGSYIFDINHARIGRAMRRLEFYLKLGSPSFSLRNAAIFFKKRFLRFVSTSLSLCLFFISFISRGSFANACPEIRFHREKRCRKCWHERYFLYENNKTVLIRFDSILLRYGLIFLSNLLFYFLREDKKKERN